MKNSPSLVRGLSLVLALVSALSATAAPSQWSDWMQNYYLNPEADRLVPAVFAMSRDGDFETVGQPATAIGFLGAVFADNPGQVAGWVRAFHALPARHQRIVASALWYSGLPEGLDYMRELAHGTQPAVRAEVEALMAWERPSLQETPVLSTSSMNLQWGAFLGSGNPEHIVRLFAALGSDEGALSSAARLALAEKALAHPRVYEICQREIARRPAEVQDQLRTALGTSDWRR